MFIAALLATAEIWKQSRHLSIEKWIKKMFYKYTHIHNRILFSNKKYEILPFVKTWMDTEGIILSELSQIEKNKYCMISFVCGIKNLPK